MNRDWFYHRTAGWEKGDSMKGIAQGLSRTDFRWIDRQDYPRMAGV
ncbi:MAG: hypothetical protein OJF52_003511 [Nitrospira sp.]|nr:MAG: hypothetical protein OJF52_003511 [Nitrospira sp.]